MLRALIPAAFALALAPLANPHQAVRASPLGSQAEANLGTLAAKPQASEFEVEVEAARTRIAAARGAAGAELAKGDVASVVKAMQAAASARATKASEALALGNELFLLDPGSALAAHAKARELAPDERSVLAAWGRELHREGRFPEAAQAYKAAIEREHPEAPVLHALRAAVLLRAGAIEEALAAWDVCAPLQWHSVIRDALRAIHRRGDKELERRDLLARFRADEPEALERLLLHDLAWAGDGDYPTSNRPYVAQDLALALEKHGKDSRRYAEYEYLANGRMGMEPRPKDAPAPVTPDIPERGEGTGFGAALPPSAVEKGGRRLGFVGYGKTNKRFPVSSVLAPAIFRMLFLDGDIVSSEWIGWFEDEMKARATAEKGDIDAALLLLDLYEQTLTRKFDGWEKTPEKHAEWQRITWERHPDARVAGRILAWKAKDLAQDDPVLKAALERFPDDAKIAAIAVDAARRAGGKVPENLLVASARAAFAEENVMEVNRHLVELKLLRAKQRDPGAENGGGAPK